MAIEVKVPGVGESVKEGMIGSWRKSSGDFVTRDEVLLELETDKATVEVIAEASGKLQIIAQAGTVVKIGEVIAKIEEAEAAAVKQPSTSTQTAKAPASEKEDNNGPAVRRIAEETGINPRDVSGTGKDGRVTKGDMLAHAASSGESKVAKTEASKSAQPVASPQASVNLKTTDIAVGTLATSRQDTRKPMSMMRRRIAERLVSSQNTAAILTTFNELDMTAVNDLRKRYADKFQEKHGIKLGFMGFFIKASVDALQAFPEINAFIDGNDIVYHNYCDFSVAVSTEKGLVTPVIRDCDKMNIAQVELAIAAMAKKARENKISIDDLTGGTFTISNGGIFGSLMSTPIINPPQTAILGMHKTQLRPVVMPDGKIEARPMMYLALSYDHRMVDGKEAVQFLVRIKENLEDPARLLLGV